MKGKTVSIIPSTRLLSVSVHKLQATSCPRYYFWMWILNMVPKGFNTNFWWGAVLGEGVEVLLETKDIKTAKKAMDIKHKDFIQDYLLEPGTAEEIEFQLKMLKRILEAWADTNMKYIKSVKITGREVKFSVELTNSPVIFNGALDADGEVDNTDVMFEIKSASSMSLNNDYFAHLQFDKQINGYRCARRKGGRVYSKCHYLVFRKPMIQVRQKETPDEFLDRLSEDLRARADWYFIKCIHVFGKRAANDVLMDIEGMTFDLFAKYGYFTVDQLLNPMSWPRNDRQCFNYGTCPYFRLCSDCTKYHLYTKCYKQRELRYPLEEREVDKTRTLKGPKLTIKRGEIDDNR